MRDKVDSDLRDKGLHELARELSSSIFLTSGGIGISYPSPYTERRIVKPKESTTLIHDRIRKDYRNEMAALARRESSSDCRDEIVHCVGEKWGRKRSTVEEVISVTAPSSAVE